MAGGARGTVVPLAEAIVIPDVDRAIQHMKEAIGWHANDLQELHKFLDDNIALSKLLRTLPESVCYKVMVPFGKLAFFPGSLIHTNEFLVLLGGGYYSERSAKQAIDIIERRNNFLESKITNVKSQISDLQAEIEFALDTVAEAAGGIVEIREDYYEPSSQSSDMMPDLTAMSPPILLHQTELTHERANSRIEELSMVKDEEHERLMARLSEIEMAETAANAKGGDIESELEYDGGLGGAKVLDKAGDDDGENEAKYMLEDLESAMVDMEEYDIKSTKGSEMLMSEEHDSESIEDEHEYPHHFTENMLVTSRYTNNRSSSVGNIREHGYRKSYQQESMRLASSEDGGHTEIGSTTLIRSPADFLEFEQFKQQQLDQENLEEGKLMGEDGAPQFSYEVKGARTNINKQQKEVSNLEEEEVSALDESITFQKQAFSGKVIECADAFPAVLNSKSKMAPRSTISRFKKRQGGT